MEDGNGNSIGSDNVGDENKKTTGACDSESDSRTASAGAVLADVFAVENGLSCKADRDDDDVVEVVGEDLEEAVDLDSVAGALREVRLDA